jgi:hypothetical protein
LYRSITNKFFNADPGNSQRVEWAYSFDIHLNAYFPTLVILHLMQVFLLHESWHSTTAVFYFGNALWLIALSYYTYITFLGYSSEANGTLFVSREMISMFLVALPFLKKTVLFLYVIPLLVILYFIAIPLNIGCSSLARDFYKELSKP